MPDSVREDVGNCEDLSAAWDWAHLWTSSGFFGDLRVKCGRLRRNSSE